MPVAGTGVIARIDRNFERRQLRLLPGLRRDELIDRRPGSRIAGAHLNAGQELRRGAGMPETTGAIEALILKVTAVVSEAVRDGDSDLKGVFAGVDRSQTGFERSQVRERWVASRRSALAVYPRS